MRVKFQTLFIGAVALLAFSVAAEVSISGDHPGGNIIVVDNNNETIQVKQDLTGVKGWWFLWNMMVDGVEGDSLTFEFTDGNVIGTRGPAYSLDMGRTWAWLGTKQVRSDGGRVGFTYTVPAHGNATLLAFAPAYVESDLARFLKGVEHHPNLRVDALCQSEEKRPVERVRVGQLSETPKHRIFLTARHHACESMASYVLEGIFASVLAETEDGAWFREHIELMAIPFVDKDGVENGHQGKNRIPRDHGRDYANKAIYNSTRSIRETVPDWADGRLRIALDLHCPHIRGAYNEFIYQVGQEDPAVWQEQQRFARIMAAVPDPALPYKATNDLPFGERWNTGNNYTQGMPMARWASTLPGVQLASTIEVPYANAGEVTITTERARAFGGTLASAIRGYLETLKE
jgi:hypothetical protein